MSKTINTPSAEKLLQNRAVTAEQLGGCSTSKLRRLEARGLLTAIRFGPSPHSPVFYRTAEVRDLVDKLANGGAFGTTEPQELSRVRGQS
ncbi:MAG: hypothetical protein WBB88_03755 [Methyloceanibacter sp.]|jgi:hypothetical protein